MIDPVVPSLFSVPFAPQHPRARSPEAFRSSPYPCGEYGIELRPPVRDLALQDLDLPVALEQLAVGLFKLPLKLTAIIGCSAHGRSPWSRRRVISAPTSFCKSKTWFERIPSSSTIASRPPLGSATASSGSTVSARG